MIAVTGNASITAVLSVAVIVAVTLAVESLSVKLFVNVLVSIMLIVSVKLPVLVVESSVSVDVLPGKLTKVVVGSVPPPATTAVVTFSPHADKTSKLAGASQKSFFIISPAKKLRRQKAVLHCIKL